MASSEVPNTPEASNKEDIYWQVDKSVGECTVELYEKKRWTDVNFRCMDHVTDDPEDRLRAHKLILAARSPVFSAMFYGPNSEAGTTEVQVSEYSKAAMDAFLRFLYHDFTVIDSTQSEEVLKIAHFYQVTRLVDFCCNNISQNLTTENACQFLNVSIIYEQKTLVDQILNFIDNNAKEVLKSRSFLEISRDSLLYLLKGDTLFVPEIEIIKAVHDWAAPRLTALNKKITGQNIREQLGDAFYFLRMPAMSVDDFIKLERRFGYHSHDECCDIVSHISRKVPTTLCTHTSVPRVVKTKEMTGCSQPIQPSSEVVRMPVVNPSFGCFSVQPAGIFGGIPAIKRSTPASINNLPSLGGFGVSRSVSFELKEGVTVTKVGIDIPPFVLKCGNLQSTAYHETPVHLPILITVRCPQTMFNQSKEMTVDSGERQLPLDPPMLIPHSTTDTTLTVIISCPSKPWVSLKPSEQEDSRYLLKYIVVSHPSKRDAAKVEVAEHDDDEEQLEDEETLFASTSGKKQLFGSSYPDVGSASLFDFGAQK